MAARGRAEGRLRWRRLAVVVAGLCGLEATLASLSSNGSVSRVASFVLGGCSGRLAGRGPCVQRCADLPKVQPEQDMGELGQEVGDMVANTLGIKDDSRITAMNRVTPIDRWFGWDKAILGAGGDDINFVDSSDESSYVTLLLESPCGIEFMQSDEEDGGGVEVAKVIPGYSAHASGLVQSGYHLIFADDKPVYGLPIDEAVKPIVDKGGPVKLTFFVGDAAFFYGDYKPSADWLAEFAERVRGMDPPLQGAAPEFQ